MKTLTITFAKTRSVEQVVSDLKFHFEWDLCDLYYTNGKPMIRYMSANNTDIDGDIEQRVRCLLYLNDIFEDEGESQTFDECFDYAYSLWGQDAEGQWFLGYSE